MLLYYTSNSKIKNTEIRNEKEVPPFELSGTIEVIFGIGIKKAFPVGYGTK